MSKKAEKYTEAEELEELIGQLRKDIQAGGITLVLGSGINTGAKIPCWDQLLECVAPKNSSKKSSLVNTLCPRPPDVLTALKIFEQSKYKRHGGVEKGKAFVEKLKDSLYSDYDPKRLSDAETLCAVGNVLVHDRSLAGPRIRRVITFNVDSLLEEYLLQFPKKAIPHPITQWYQSAMHYKPSVDIYHLHGFLPSDKYKPYTSDKKRPKYHDPSEDLVFGDNQYWDMTSRPSSLPNVVMLNALHDSHCFFIGLSMKDPNISRWLALRANEIKASKRAQTGRSDHLGDLLTRHYWFEKEPDSLTTFWLKSRGVRTIALDDWKKFSAVFKSAFNPGNHKK